MKRFLKINFLGLLILGSISSSSFGMWQAAKTRFAHTKATFTNFLRTNATLHAFKTKPQLFAQRIKLTDKNKVMLGTFFTGNAFATGYGLHKTHQYNNPTFTAENINKYDETYMEYFLEQALNNMFWIKCRDNIDAIKALWLKYPQLHQRIINAVLNDDQDCFVAQRLIEHCPEFGPQLIKVLLETDNKLAQDLDGYLKRTEPGNSSGVQVLHYIADYIIEHPRHVSIDAFNKLTQILNSQLSTYFGENSTYARDISIMKDKLKSITSAAFNEYGKPCLDDQIEYTLRNNPKEKVFTHPHCLLNFTFTSMLKDIRSGIIHPNEIRKIALDNLNFLYFNCAGMPWHNLIECRLETVIKQQKIPESISSKNLIALAILNTASYDEGQSRLEWSDYIDSLMKSLPHETKLDQPYFAYKGDLPKSKILTAVIENINELSIQHLERLYDIFFKTDQERKIVKDAAKARFGTPNTNLLTELQLSSRSFPAFLLECSPQSTASECHACSADARAAVIALLKNEKFKNVAIKTMFDSVHKKQKEEQEKGNHLFVHGRRPEWDFMSDTYKQTYNIINTDKKVGDDYTFLRFDNRGKTRWTEATDGADALWMNAALYGNANHDGSCTAKYVLEGRDFSGGPLGNNISTETIFKQFGFEKYHDTYNAEIQKLQELHAAANPSNIGNLLAISIPAKELSRVKSPQIQAPDSNFWSWFWKKPTPVENVIKSKQIRDNYAFVLPLTKDYALDPYKGPRIYSFNASDPEKYKEYQEYRDQLFAKIAQQVQADKVA